MKRRGLFDHHIGTFCSCFIFNSDTKNYWQNYSIKKRFTGQARKEETLSIFKVAPIKFSLAEIKLSQSNISVT